MVAEITLFAASVTLGLLIGLALRRRPPRPPRPKLYEPPDGA